MKNCLNNFVFLEKYIFEFWKKIIPFSENIFLNSEKKKISFSGKI